MADVNHYTGIHVNQNYTILIADRNPRVRELLKRELSSEGYCIQLAKNAREVIEQVFSHETLNLLIIDLDLPDMEGLSLMDALGDRIPTLPVIILTFHNNCEESSDLWPKKIIVEKDGNSVEQLKKIIHKMANN